MAHSCGEDENGGAAYCAAVSVGCGDLAGAAHAYGGLAVCVSVPPEP